MRIAIPIETDEGIQSKIANHFGRCIYFLVVDENKNILDKLPNDPVHQRETKLPPEILNDNQVGIILCQSLGYKALQKCNELNISVFLDTSSETVFEILQKFENKKLSEAKIDQTCKEDHK